MSVATKKVQVLDPSCILCKTKLTKTGVDFLWLHPPKTDCKVMLTDCFGVSADDDYEVKAGEIFEVTAPRVPDSDELVYFEQFTPVEKTTEAMFASYNLPRLGGASGDRGWSSFATWQRCPYLYKRTYIDHVQTDEEIAAGEPPGLAVGGLVHTLLAVHYEKKRNPRYPITPEIVREYHAANGCNPEFLVEAWRLFAPYRLFYKLEKLKPIAVEHHVVDPRSNESTRYDLIAELTEGDPIHQAGIYIVDHKTAQRFDDSTLYGWVNDGTIIQQMTLWVRLGLHRRFGELKGVIVNLLGKQKVPEYHRTFVSPNRWQMEQQTADLKIWQAQKHLAIVTENFPRARNNCIGRYGRCSQFSHCATGE